MFNYLKYLIDLVLFQIVRNNMYVFIIEFSITERYL